MENATVKNSVRFQTCPLCGSSLIYPIGPITLPHSVLFSTTKVNLEEKFEYWRCKDCESGFNQNIVSEDDARKLYTENQSNRWEAHKFTEEKTADLVGVLHKYVGRDVKVLDVGCNTGELLDYCKEMGAETYGVEYSKQCCAVCKNKGHKMFGDLDDVNEGNFDLIMAFDLVEHMYQIGEFLTKCKKLLKIGGKLIILTGDPNSWSAKLAKNKWWYAAFPEHIIFPSTVFFQKYSKLKIVSAAPVFNSINYEKSSFLYSIWKSPYKTASVIIKLIIGKYFGQPLFGKDHRLFVLENI